MYRNGFITSWTSLLQALETCFVPTFYDDPKGALFKLTQTGSVNAYLHEFERLANRIIGLSPSCLLSCFISGLLPKLQREVQALQPISLPQAIFLAKLQEDKLEDCHHGYHPRPPTTHLSSPTPAHPSYQRQTSPTPRHPSTTHQPRPQPDHPLPIVLKFAISHQKRWPIKENLACAIIATRSGLLPTNARHSSF